MTSEYVSGMKWPRWALLLFGSISVVAGVMTLMWPGVTILVLVVFLGIDILIWGLMLVTNSFRTGDGRVLGIVFGVLALIAGASLFLQPLRNLGAVVIVMSVFWLVGGAIEVIESLVERGKNWGWELLSGLVSVGAGVIAVTRPALTLLVLALVAGIWMIVIGSVRILAAFSKRTPATATAPIPA
jgi:uncharacterized membrane protein HdeD (DUF308 family)